MALYIFSWKILLDGRISQKGSGEDVLISRTLLDALCDDGKVEEAAEILEKILRKGLKAPKRCHIRIDLGQCSNAEDVDRVKRLINEAVIKGGIPRLACYSAMAIELYNENKIVDGDKVLKEMRTFKLSDSVVRGLCDGGKSACAVGFLKNMAKQVGCVADKEICGVLVDGLCREGKFLEASVVLEKVLVKFYWPCAETYNGLIEMSLLREEVI